jgi:hypothetical protein
MNSADFATRRTAAAKLAAMRGQPRAMDVVSRARRAHCAKIATNAIAVVVPPVARHRLITACYALLRQWTMQRILIIALIMAYHRHVTLARIDAFLNDVGTWLEKKNHEN